MTMVYQTSLFMYVDRKETRATERSHSIFSDTNSP